MNPQLYKYNSIWPKRLKKKSIFTACDVNIRVGSQMCSYSAQHSTEVFKGLKGGVGAVRIRVKHLTLKAQKLHYMSPFSKLTEAKYQYSGQRVLLLCIWEKKQ